MSPPWLGTSTYEGFLCQRTEYLTYQTREKEWREGLLDAGLALEPPDIFHDLIDILRSHAFDLRHVAEFPMVRLDSVGRSPLERGIAMMVRLIDLMHQRRSVVGSRRLVSMAGRAVGVEFRFACLEVGWRRTASSRLFRL